MVEIAPFRGVLYNPAEIEDHGHLLTAPPYDVLSDEERRAHHQRHPHNILHLDYGPVLADDLEPYAWHRRSAEILQEWLRENVLTRLDRPALFQVETDCVNPVSGKMVTRHGLVCLMRLEDFSKTSQVRPHEKTFSSHKKERLSLMTNTQAHLSQVFGFFPDSDGCAIDLMARVRERSRQKFYFPEEENRGHRLWINDDPELIEKFKKCLSDQTVYIADGHHRYETALNYRRRLLEQGVQAGPDSSLNYLMIYLCPMSDPGLIILPTHRLVQDFPQTDKELIEALKVFFKVRYLPAESARADLIGELARSKAEGRNSFGLYLAGDRNYYFLTLKTGAGTYPILSQAPRELANLDTYILTHLIFMEAMKLTEDDLDDPKLISYVADFEKALSAVDRGEQRAAFVINPTDVREILDVAEVGLVMPRKSSFFYPKVTTGLVMNLIDPAEQIE